MLAKYLSKELVICDNKPVSLVSINKAKVMLRLQKETEIPIDIDKFEIDSKILFAEIPRIIMSDIRKVLKSTFDKDTKHIPMGALMVIDAGFDEKLFIVDGGVFTRSDMYKNYLFTMMGLSPEMVCDQIEIGEFEPRYFDKIDVWKESDVDELPDGLHNNRLQYKSRKFGDEFTPFGTKLFRVNDGSENGAIIEDEQPKLLRVVPTKVFIGFDGWDKFKMTHGMFDLSLVKQLSCLAIEDAPIEKKDE